MVEVQAVRDDIIPRPSWQGIAAVILAAFSGLSIFTIAFGSIFTHKYVLSSEESTLIGTVVGASVGAVATYLSIRNGGHD